MKKLFYLKLSYGITVTILHAILTLSVCTLCSGQVPTFNLKGDPISNHIPYFIPDYRDPTVLPEVNVDSVLNADRINGREIPRFGIKVPVNVNTNDGVVIESDEFVIWSKAFFAEKAESLNFQFKDLNLPNEGKIYLFNSDGSMYIGPIENKHIFNTKYSTDILSGNKVTIQAIIPKDSYKEFSITISNVIFGFQELHEDSRDYDDSDECEIDVNCAPYGSGWEKERDATVRIILGEYACSGALISTTCTTLEAFILSAYHCAALNEDYDEWVFRFNYESQDPNELTNDCRGSDDVTWLTYTGADLRASWYDSDFALLELFGKTKNQPGIAFAGWDRSNYEPERVCGIHHPVADVKKISLSYNAVDVEGYGGGYGSDYFKVIWSHGVTEGGSSGSPLFDILNHRIVGQLKGGSSSCNNPTDPDWYGRLYSSWTGGGNSSERLSDWLGSGTSISSYKSPYISSSHVGPICTTNATYVLNDQIPGRLITWDVTPTNLFATSGGASTSGSGITAVVRANSGSSSGLATLTFYISNPTEGCSATPISIPLWIGIPGSLFLDESMTLCYDEEGILPLDYPDGAGNTIMGVTSTTWSYTGPISYFWSSSALAKFSGNTTGHGYVNVTITNVCGSEYLSMPYSIMDCERSAQFTPVIYPNPSSGNVNLSLTDRFADVHFDQDITGKGKIRIINGLGRIVMEDELRSCNQELKTRNLEPGTYVVEIIMNNVIHKTNMTIIK